MGTRNGRFRKKKRRPLPSAWDAAFIWDRRDRIRGDNVDRSWSAHSRRPRCPNSPFAVWRLLCGPGKFGRRCQNQATTMPRQYTRHESRCGCGNAFPATRTTSPCRILIALPDSPVQTIIRSVRSIKCSRKNRFRRQRPWPSDRRQEKWHWEILSGRD